MRYASFAHCSAMHNNRDGHMKHAGQGAARRPGPTPAEAQAARQRRDELARKDPAGSPNVPGLAPRRRVG
jgi:hypothetical protein